MPAIAVESLPNAVTPRVTRDVGLLLRPIRGQADLPIIPLAQGRHVLGSAPEADIRFETPGVEPQHAVLLVGPQRTILKAFSRFTWVNDGVVRECAVKPGDRLCFGPVEFEILKGKSRRRASSEAAAPPQTADSSFRTPRTGATFVDTPVSAIDRRDAASEYDRSVDLNAQLLKQLGQLVERETVAADRERRLVEQSAQLEGRRRILDQRQAEFEQAQSDLTRAEHEWRRRSQELASQTEQLHADRERLESDRQRISTDLSTLESQSRVLDERRRSLESREARLNQTQAELDGRVRDLAERERTLNEQRTQFEVKSRSDAAAIQNQLEQLHAEREQLAIERAQFDSDHDKLFTERAHLATREVEIAELRRELHEREAELERRREEVETQTSSAAPVDAADYSAELAARESELSALEESLILERRDLDERKSQLEQHHAEWMLHRHTEAARESEIERDHADAVAEVELLRGQLGALQNRLREERSIWEQERSEWLAREAEATTVPAMQSGIADEATPESLLDELDQLRAELEAERTRFDEEREQWNSEQELLLRDRRALEMEWRRLEEEAERRQAVLPGQPVQHYEEMTPPPIPEHMLDEAQDSMLPDSDDHFGVYQADVAVDAVELDPEEQSWAESSHLAMDDEGQAPQIEEDQQYENSQYIAETAEDQSAGVLSGWQQPEDADADVAPAGEVNSLRAQLAELFGIQATHRPEENEIEQFADEDQQSEELYEGRLESEVEEPAEEPSSTSQFDELSENATEDETTAQSDEEIMSSYLARLLKKSPEETVAIVKPAVVPTSEAAEESQESQQAEPEQPRVARRLNAEEKVTLRANLDSFRELANQQARAAVAKHKSNELKSGLQTTSVAAVLIGVVAAILLTAEFWCGQSYRLYGLLCLAVAAGIGGYALFNGIRIRRLKKATMTVAEMAEALSEEEEPSAR